MEFWNFEEKFDSMERGNSVTRRAQTLAICIPEVPGRRHQNARLSGYQQTGSTRSYEESISDLSGMAKSPRVIRFRRKSGSSLVVRSSCTTVFLPSVQCLSPKDSETVQLFTNESPMLILEASNRCTEWRI
jgi:hypothetical protein